MEKSLTESGPLQDDGRDQEIQRHCTVPIAFQEGHQEPETDEHHNVDILKHWKEQQQQRKKRWIYTDK